MRHLSDKIVDDASLKNICRQAKAEGKTIVSTSGCFDLLHAGHVKYLEQAKEKGDLLILLLNSDASKWFKISKDNILLQKVIYKNKFDQKKFD